MEKKSFTAVGTNSSIKKPDYKKTILDDISKSAEPIVENEEVLNKITFLLKQETIEKIKDVVYTEKMAGNLTFTQRDLIEQALDVYLLNKKVTKRPNNFIERRGRKS